jgi:hypothetical protein
MEEPNGSLQQPATGTYPEPDESIPQTHTPNTITDFLDIIHRSVF